MARTQSRWRPGGGGAAPCAGLGSGMPPRATLFFGPEGLHAKWRALLFVAGLVLAMEATLVPVNWLSARGLLSYPGSWSAAVEWAVFAAALLPTLAASLL